MGTVQSIPISSIVVASRIRKELGDIDSLTRNIRELGLLSPIVINQNFQLLAGERRLAACKQLGWDSIDAVIKDTSDAEQEKLIELAENEFRKSFTMEEVINVGIELERIEKVKAEERKGTRTDMVVNLPPGYNPGKTRDVIARKLGISGTQYEHCKFIMEHKDLVSDESYSAWNNREMSTNKIYTVAKKIFSEIAGKENRRIATIEVSKEADKIPGNSKKINKMKDDLAAKDRRINELESMAKKIKDAGDVTREESQSLIAEYEEKIRGYEAEISRLKKSQYSPEGQEINAAYEFWVASEQFVNEVLATIRYNDVVINTKDSRAGEWILKACRMLTDAATDIIKRFNTKEAIIIDMED